MALPARLKWFALPIDLVLLLWECLIFLFRRLLPPKRRQRNPYCERLARASKDAEPRQLCLRSRSFTQVGVFRCLCPYCDAAASGRASHRRCLDTARQFPPLGRWVRAVLLSAGVLGTSVVLLGAIGLRLAGKDPVRAARNIVRELLPRRAKADPGPAKTGEVSTKPVPIVLGPGGVEIPADAQVLLARAKKLQERGDLREAYFLCKDALAKVEPNVDLHLAMARSALSVREREEAREQLQKAIELDPLCLEAALMLARMSFAEFEYNEALSKARMALALDAKHVEARVLVCRCLRQLGQLEQAEEEARKAHKAAPGDTNVELALAAILTDRRRWQEAEELIRAILGREPENIGASLALARLFQRQERMPEADKVLRGLRAKLAKMEEAPAGVSVYERPPNLEKTPRPVGGPRLWAVGKHADYAHLAEAMVRYAESQVLKGDTEGALETYRHVTTRFPTLYHCRGRLAKLLLHAGQPDEAYRLATKLDQDHPRDVGANIVLGTILYSRGLRALAEKHCQTVLDSGDPRSAAIYVLYGKLALAEGDVDGAVRHFQKAVKQQPADHVAPILLANCLSRRGERAAAVQTLWEAIERVPVAVADLHLELGKIYMAMGKFDDALKRYEAASAMRPVNPVALSNLGLLLLQKGEKAKAMATLRAARKQFPSNPMIAHALAVTQSLQGDFAGAVGNLRFAVECFPMNLDFQTDLATALNQAGQKVEAKLVLQRILGSGREFRRRKGAQKLLASLTPKDE